LIGLDATGVARVPRREPGMQTAIAFADDGVVVIV